MAPRISSVLAAYALCTLILRVGAANVKEVTSLNAEVGSAASSLPLLQGVEAADLTLLRSPVAAAREAELYKQQSVGHCTGGGKSGEEDGPQGLCQRLLCLWSEALGTNLDLSFHALEPLPTDLFPDRFVQRAPWPQDKSRASFLAPSAAAPLAPSRPPPRAATGAPPLEGASSRRPRGEAWSSRW
jgi:hypothetical protein